MRRPARQWQDMDGQERIEFVLSVVKGLASTFIIGVLVWGAIMVGIQLYYTYVLLPQAKAERDLRDRDLRDRDLDEQSGITIQPVAPPNPQPLTPNP